jgi:hypothetical protein
LLLLPNGTLGRWGNGRYHVWPLRGADEACFGVVAVLLDCCAGFGLLRATTAGFDATAGFAVFPVFGAGLPVATTPPSAGLPGVFATLAGADFGVSESRSF